MGQVLEHRRSSHESRPASSVVEDSPSRAADVYVVFTSVDETLAAVQVASRLAKALTTRLTVIHFQAVPYPLATDAPSDHSPAEMDAFVDALRGLGIGVRVRVYLCRDPRREIASAFKSHSLIVIGGHRSWWPTRSERWRRALEAAGHLVVFVDKSEHSALGHAGTKRAKESSHA
jgi:hypothetical protein